MKEIEITIEGDLIAVDYCATKRYEEGEEFNDVYYVTYGWDKVNEMRVDGVEGIDNEENVVKKKGKYVKTREFFHDLFSEEGEHPLPVEIHDRYYYGVQASYILQLPDDEEFDIKKVQLVKSDYEVELYPYFIIANYILYDGKKVETWDLDDYCPEEKCYNEFTIDKFCY